MTDYDEAHEIYVGDRFVCEDLRITVTGVDGNFFEYSYMGHDRSRVYHTRAVLPVPTTWTKVGAAPAESEPMCVGCGKVEAEPDSVYCWNCTVINAPRWATLSEEEANWAMNRLLGKDPREEETDDGEG